MEPVAVGLVVVLALAVGAVLGAWWQRRRQPEPADRSVPDPAGPIRTGTLEAIDALVADSVRRLATWLSPDGGASALPVAEDGTLTLLFSDIVESTTLNRQLGDDAFATLVADHDERADAVVRRHRGRVVKTQGDGFLAAFGAPHQAVRAALDLRGDLADPDTLGRSLTLRIGIHTGEVVTTAGDVFGETVAFAARVASTARPGQVLVSAAVRDGDGHPDDVRWTRRWLPARFKGLPGMHRLHLAGRR